MLVRCVAAMAIAAALAAQAGAQIGVPNASVEQVSIPWQAGNAASFQAGTPDEGGARSDQGLLPASIVRPNGAGPFPFVVLLHGCGGLQQPAMWNRWAQPWAALLVSRGIGAAIVDSFTPRGVEQVCRSKVGVWAVRRADDAYSVRAWLAKQPFVDASRIAVMGMSNGGRTVLSAMRADLKHAAPFVAGIALYPGCQSDVAARFYAPLLVLMGRDDSVTPVGACEAMAQQQPAGAEVKLVVYPHAPHTFDMNLPDRTQLGMQLGYSREATEDARLQVIAFLAARGIGH
jgi:dienelactone hydrolase